MKIKVIKSTVCGGKRVIVEDPKTGKPVPVEVDASDKDAKLLIASGKAVAVKK